jgi:hypothetical protein
VVKELSQYVFVSESRNYKVNFTAMFITRKAVRNSCVFTVKSCKFYLQISRKNLTPTPVKNKLKQPQIYNFFLKFSVFVR